MQFVWQKYYIILSEKNPPFFIRNAIKLFDPSSRQISVISSTVVLEFFSLISSRTLPIFA